MKKKAKVVYLLTFIPDVERKENQVWNTPPEPIKNRQLNNVMTNGQTVAANASPDKKYVATNFVYHFNLMREEFCYTPRISEKYSWSHSGCYSEDSIRIGINGRDKLYSYPRWSSS